MPAPPTFANRQGEDVNTVKGCGVEFTAAEITPAPKMIFDMNSTWPRIQKAFAEFEWTTDALFASFEGRTANMHELQRQVEASLATLSSEEAVKRMRENDLPGARVLPLAEIPNDPQVQHNGSFVVGEGGPGTGPMRLPRPAPLFSGTPVDTGFSPAPALGADTVEVLTTVGYSAARISAMKDDGVLGPTIPPPTILPP